MDYMGDGIGLEILIKWKTQVFSRYTVNVDPIALGIQNRDQLRNEIYNLLKLFLGPLTFRPFLGFTQRAPHSWHDPRYPRLENVVGGTAFQRLDRNLFAHGSRHKDEWNFGQ